jgi:serine/threonine protein kinase/WD40 repeat protein
MALSAGTKLGPYEVVSVLGAGGMGEVYKARDTRLGRIVAIKVLPAGAASNRNFRERFAREARAISALDHPNICALYDVGVENGIDFLVMQYLEGETLAERLKRRGALPLADVHRYAVEVADALDRAHRAGIVHRDLKPANIMLTGAGAKLLDFGVAKLVTDSDSADMPTATMRAAEALTAPGQAPGTIYYMSPEQVTTSNVDARSDLFAFGAIVFEMVTGRRAFEGANVVEIADAILHHDPPSMSSLVAGSPPLLDQVVAKCLQKEPGERWQTARDLRDALKWSADHHAGLPRIRAAIRPRRHAVSVALLLVSLGAGAVYLLIRSGTIRLPSAGDGTPGRTSSSGSAPTRAPAPPAVDAPTSVLLSISLPKNVAIPPNGPELALSPDGRRVVFRALRDDASDVRRLYVRSIDSSEVTVLPGTENARHPFWSPDGSSVGFFAHSKLKRHDLVGGATHVLCDAPSPRGGSWSVDGRIIFAPNSGDGGLFAVSAQGGPPQRITAIDTANGEQSHTWPVALQDGARVLLGVEGSNASHAGTYLHSLQSGTRTRVLSASSSVVYAAGHIVFQSGGELLAAAFDPDRSALAGEPFTIADNVFTTPRRADFSVANNVLAYWRRAQPRGQVTWTDRSGRILQAVPSPTPIRDPSLSPDGRTIAFSGAGGTATSSDIWLLDWAKSTRRRISFEKASEYYPVWSPDGKRIVFTSDRAGTMQLYLKDVARGTEDLLLATERDAFATHWSKDGRYVVFEEREARGGTMRDLYAVPLARPADVKPLVVTAADEREGKLSPNGRWLAYTSNESGRWQVFVRLFENLSRVWQVSEDGGIQPEWSPDGKELFFLTNDRKIMTVSVGGAPGSEFGPARVLFAAPAAYARPRSLYAVSADGQRFVFSAAPSADQEFITVVTHWHRRE